MTGKKIILAGLAVTLLLTGAPSGADVEPGAVVFSGPGSYLTTYTTVVAAAHKGGPLTFVNADPQLHDVVAGAPGNNTIGPDRPWCNDLFGSEATFAPGTCPLFWSLLIGIAETTKVWGTESLEPGVLYDFYCSIHPLMRGKLVALPAAVY